MLALVIVFNKALIRSCITEVNQNLLRLFGLLVLLRGYMFYYSDWVKYRLMTVVINSIHSF